MNIENNDLKHFIENSIGSDYYVDVFENDKDCVYAQPKSKEFQMKIIIKKNSNIYLPSYEKVVERDFITFEFNYSGREINYVIVENDGKFQVYTTKYGFSKTLIKEFKNLNQEVFDFVFKEIQKIREKRTEDDLFPVYKQIGEILLIDWFRYYDCIAMVKGGTNDEIYNKTLEGTLTSILKKVKEGSKVYMLEHDGFDYIENEADLKLIGVIKQKFTLDSFKKHLEDKTAKIVGINKIGNYDQILAELKTM